MTTVVVVEDEDEVMVKDEVEDEVEVVVGIIEDVVVEIWVVEDVRDVEELVPAKNREWYVEMRFVNKNTIMAQSSQRLHSLFILRGTTNGFRATQSRRREAVIGAQARCI